MLVKRWGFIGVVILAAMFLSLQQTARAAEEAEVKDTTPEYVKLLNQSRELTGKGDTSGARSALEKAQKLAPKDAGVERALIENYMAANADDDASAALLKVLTTEDFNDLKEWAIGPYYMLAQKKEGVDPALKKIEAVGKKSKNVGTQRAIAEGYVRLSDWPKVAEVYETLVKDNPKESGYSVRLIDAYMLSKNYDGVIKILEPAVTANPNDVGSSDVLAHAYVRAGKKDEAIALYKKKLEKDPNSAGLRGRYAQALQDLGMPDESLAEWSSAFKLDPSNFLFKQKMGEVNMELGKTKEARKQYAELLALIPANQAPLKDSISARIKDIDAMGKKK